MFTTGNSVIITGSLFVCVYIQEVVKLKMFEKSPYPLLFSSHTIMKVKFLYYIQSFENKRHPIKAFDFMGYLYMGIYLTSILTILKAIKLK